MRWPQMVAVGLLGGIGFTVSVFITDLAFPDATPVVQAKFGVLMGSLIAGAAGYMVLRLTTSSAAVE